MVPIGVRRSTLTTHAPGVYDVQRLPEEVKTMARTEQATRHSHSVEHSIGPRSRFWRHFFEMVGAMAVGMIATGAIFMSVVGLKTWDEVTAQFPTQALLAQAAGMSIPMVGWMLYRGMGWGNSVEMTAAMVLPVVPFLCLVWFGVTESAQCGAYCAITLATMLALMRFRKGTYSMEM
jgi:hypothetical protein